MSMQQSTELIIFVTHVEAEDSLLKIWGQVDKNSATCIERMILPLGEQFARSQGCIDARTSNLRINALCCARFQNEGYYRARVINIRADGMVVLQFIDYGNIEVLPPQEIHLIENIPGSESLQSFPPVAFEFTLMNVLPVNGIWENKIIESIKKSLCYNEYKILICAVINNHRFIKLWYNNENFSDLLIDRHMAVRATVPDMFRLKCVQQPQMPIYQQSSKHLISNNCTPVAPVQNPNSLHCEESDIHRYQRNVPLYCTAQQKHLMQTPMQEALVFKSRVLDVPSEHEVYVSFVEDGPQKFSVQLQSTSQVLSMLMKEINSHPIQPLQEPPLPGSVCLGRYTQDKVLCRAVVMSVMENKCKLYYVDFGHTEVLPYADIFQLPSHFINPKVLSIRFTLSGVHELNVTDEMKKYFKQIVSGKLLGLHVRPPEGPPLVQYGDLYDDGKNIKNILRQAFPTPVTVTPMTSSFGYEESKQLSRGVEEIVHVSFVESCRKFFVQLDSNSTSLESIMNCLAKFCQNAPILNLAQLKIGLPCAALYDNQWYRAQILGINANNVKVLYVDYGNEETVTVSSLRLMHDNLIKTLEAQAIRCILNGWEVLPCTQEIHNQFELLILEKRLRLKVIDVNPDGIVVELYDPEKMESIKSQMLRMIGDDKKVTNESNFQNMENQHTTKLTSKLNQSENTNKWQKKSQLDTWHDTQNTNTVQERNKSKTWKDESNEGKLYESRNEKSNFHRIGSRNERFHRDDSSNSRNTRDTWNNKNDYNEPSKSGPGGRGAGSGRNRSSGYAQKSNTFDKSWSDKDSDTSSRSSGRRGKGNASREGYHKHEGFSGRMQSSRSSDKDSDGSVKATKINSDSYHGSNKFRERRGGYRHRASESKSNTAYSSNTEGGRRYSPMRRQDFHIPSPSIVIGTTKTCEVVFTNSPFDFFIQLSTDYAALDSLMENIASIYETGGELLQEFKIRKGMYCIAQYTEDLKWYRAIIKSVEGNSATVQFVDYGNTETVEFNKIKTIQKEFLKLPVQSIHCKLFGIKDISFDMSKTNIFEDKVSGKTLEAEFITEENGIYGVLLREIINGSPISTFINEEFCEDKSFLKAKDVAISRSKITTNTGQLTEPDYAPLNATWETISFSPGTRKDVIVTWFTNPNNFYCQILDNENEFKIMMNEIQKMYVGREPVSYTLKIGSPVIAIFSEDKALYRGEVIELNKLNGHLIHYIDFGNSAVVNPQKIYSVEKKLLHLPKQAVQCSLLNIIPQDGHSWSKVNTEAIDNCFNADKYECTFHDIIDNKYIISLNNNENDVATTLVEKNLASLASTNKSDDTSADSNNPIPVMLYEIEKVDINLLSGQALRVKVSSVENASKLYVRLPSANECEDLIDTYMADKNPKVMQRLSAHELCLSTGCLVYSNGVWRRAVINSHSRSTGFNVKLIDSGAYDEILSDCVLALPGELSVMQNQAIECSLLGVTPSSDTDATLKKCVEGKEVIIYVHEVDNNRLIVKLFDLLGNKISIFEEVDEKISPICPMPILSSTHKVTVSYADHSTSIWLQRNTENILDQNLIKALKEYYPTSGKLIEPEVGILCAAKSVDGQWYRAKVIKCTESGIYVNFIDYGNNEEVTRDLLMTLDPSFYVPHQLAVNVSLPVTLNGTVGEQLNILQNYLSNKELTAIFRNVNKKWITELLCDGEKISDKFTSLNLTSQQEISGTSQPKVHNVTVNHKYDVCVSHVDSPSQFWLQCAEDVTHLSMKQDELQTEATKFPQVDGILEEGSLCVAMYTIDNVWYRAQVLDADEDITTVRFIDYGNTDVIDNKSGHIRQISDSWKEIKEYAIKCRLDVIPTDSEDWNATTCTKFENLVTSVESLQAFVIAEGIPKRVDLLINDKSVSEKLVEDHHAVMIHTEDDLIDEIVDLELDPHSAFVSHINSPGEFWVQEEKSVGDLEVMTDRFIVADMFPKVDEIKENMLCVAKYPDDEYWYRARVISHSDNATRVIYIDYGNSATSTEIRAIPPDLADVPPLSRKCCLAMPEGITQWSEQACTEFIKLAADGATIFLLDVLKEDDMSTVKLTLNGENVTDLLANFCERCPPIIEERLPPLGEENSPNVYISCTNSPDEFWIQTESSTVDLDMMLDRLEAAPSFLPLNTFEVGTICAAKYSKDDLWYRAKILSHSENSTEVQYIDYGNTAITDEVRMLPVDIINIPTLAKRCALQKPDTINCWASEACKTFEDLAEQGKTEFQFEIINDAVDPILIKLTLDGKDVVDTLVSFSENLPNNTDIIQEKENLYGNQNISEELEAHVGNENNDNIDQDTMAKTGEDQINYSVEQDLNNSITKSEEVLEIHEEQNKELNKSLENLEDQNKMTIKDTDSVHSYNSNFIVELTVDEIIQNMERNVKDEPDMDEKPSGSNDTNIDSFENNDIEKITKTVENLETQDTSQLTEMQEVDIIPDKDEDYLNRSEDQFEAKSIHEEELPSMAKEDITTPDGTKTQIDPNMDEEDHLHQSKDKSIADKHEDHSHQNEDESEVKSVHSEVSPSKVKEDVNLKEAEMEVSIGGLSKDEGQLDQNEGRPETEFTHAEDMQASIPLETKKDDEKLKSIEDNIINSITQSCSNETRLCEPHTDIDSYEHDTEVHTTELDKSSDKQSIETQLNKSVTDNTLTNVLDEETASGSTEGKTKSDNEKCKIENDDKLNISITDNKNDIEIKSTNKKQSLDFKSVETINNECKISDKQDDKHLPHSEGVDKPSE
ncbi:tudor domain-containing 6-like isoform X1 [Hylaeus anthracinus]|uniref:tudor domain-containing 6-like isoform X1 n=1 Tax=Hylaeus anthracinus TaxID=313031 RepID=UPI0023B8991F|nr:tudor domain-containing 6-like isoform X1 [Hylaeus anthracinus]XP_054006331.1 tudor domain-containing 6-like isoform X1 [Hylaeus anthracinus]XP_054006332.1 tudor domain-containing 6-like isoform X1 [Hylaeus anthracinus]XP_054006333.1 tudor domain-containing 6-like isoform X1 [Hylaeus anthracinus]